MARLEERLGIRPLDRTTESLNVTAEGQAYYRSCLKVLEEVNAAETLRNSFVRLCVMPVLKEVADRNPDLNPEISLTDRQLSSRKGSTWCGWVIREIMRA